MGDDKYLELDNIENIYIHEPSQGGIFNESRDFTMTCDQSEAISGTIGAANSKAIYSSNKSFINLAGSIGELFPVIFMGIIVANLNIRWAFIISAGFMFFILLVYISPALRNDNVVKTRNIN
ncbi:hypothetical protein [Halocella sp. SP3-1]|uniref:hypothetical protein n=1 Tax=Halocella sp. SP3-1 TaxID=2382161 RepID=UPI000F764D41|nr:hypothetical protein [Halocella sp. SP3-1]AZO95377.1 hypothetical protein D7D81_12665 [Halocella sp. SP3-1]